MRETLGRLDLSLAGILSEICLQVDYVSSNVYKMLLLHIMDVVRCLLNMVDIDRIF